MYSGIKAAMGEKAEFPKQSKQIFIWINSTDNVFNESRTRNPSLKRDLSDSEFLNSGINRGEKLDFLLFLINV